jgi:pimeloyl-ACP methyl ester carboxylesterase
VHLPRIVVNRAALRTMRCDLCAFPNEWPDTLARRNTRLRADLERYDWTSRAASVEAPTLIVHGERDFNPVATAQEWASLIPDSRLVVVPRCGHLPWIDAPDVFFPAVHEFLSG